MGNRSFVGKVEILGSDEILGWERRRRSQGIQALKSQAAAGDQRAVAKLNRLRAALSTTSVPFSAATPAPFGAPSYPRQTYAPVSYSYPSYQAPAYQTPYFDASLSQDPYGPAPQPTIDVFQGDDDILGILLDSRLDPVKPRGSEFMLGAFVGDDEREAAASGGRAEKMALLRRIRSRGR